MMKTLRFSRIRRSIPVCLFLACAALLLVGCPYSSTVPLSPPSVEVDSGFYGKWVLDSTDDNPAYYLIEEIDGLVFALNKYSWDSDSETYTIDNAYQAWFTDIREARFMNVEDTADQGTFYLYRIEMDGPMEFTLYEVTDNIDESFDSSEEMSAFFEEYRNLSFFYNKDEELYHKQGDPLRKTKP
jgi:hypothetical protein